MRDFIKRVLPLFRPYRRTVIIGLVFVIAGNASQALGPWILRKAVNGMETSLSAEMLWTYAGLILLAAAGSGLSRIVARRTIIGTSRRIEYDMRQGLLGHLVQMEPGFYDRSRIGDLMTRSTSDIEQVRMVIGPALMYSMNTLFGFVFGVSLMLTISPVLTLIVLVIAPVVAGVVFIMGRKVHVASRESQEAFSSLSAAVQENLSGIRVVKAFRQEQAQKEYFGARSDHLLDRNVRLVLLQGAFMPSIMLVFGVAVAGILLLGGWLIIEGTILVGDFVAFISYLMMLTWPMISIGWVVSLFQRGKASIRRIDELLERDPALPDPEDPVVPDNDEGSVRMEHVTFTYPSAERSALRDISFELEPGRTLGIVGRVGSGKSSIAMILSRLYEIDEGRVEVDGVDLSRLTKKELRERVAIVPQEPLLFSTTVRQNITMGGDHSDEEVEQAVQISQLAEDLDDFPHGLATEVGERGVTLSGGQKQRVAIARAVIRRPEIIVFDDALSAVDADTEERILENLAHYLKKRTAIIISHRITSVAEADEILVLHDGEIVERGVHGELMEKKGVYMELFRRQELARELEGVA